MLVPAAAAEQGIPAAIVDYARKTLRQPAALVGCRAATIAGDGDGDDDERLHAIHSLDCCEYDIAVFFAPPGIRGRNSVARLEEGHHVVEVMHLGEPRENIAAIEATTSTAILGDTETFSLSSSLQGITSEMRRKALAASGRKSLASSLFCQQKMRGAQKDAVAVSAMWLKIGAYRFVQGALALAGARPMPLHELAQTRHTELAPEAAEGIEVALECIGIERATRPAIARSLEALAEIKSGDYDRELVISKASHLLEKSMLADCYYYLGRVAADSLAGRQGAFHVKYAKLVQLSMDLASDSQRLEKLQKSLSHAARKALLQSQG
jgi:hypothetical protein